MSEPTVTIKGKEYKRKIIGYGSLTEKQKKKLRELPHLWKLGYCGSLIEKDTVIEVYRPLTSIEAKIGFTKEEKEENLEEIESEEWEQVFQMEDEESEIS